MENEFTTLLDSDGLQIFEGDTVEYYEKTYCNQGSYQEGRGIIEGNAYLGQTNFVCVVAELPEGFIERAIANGYTAKDEWTMVNGTKCVLMKKPCVGVVKWNSKLVTYEPVIDSQDDYNHSSFHYVVNNENAGKGSYCKVLRRA